MAKPVLGKIPEKVPSPHVPVVPPKKRWRFSFQYWKQVDHFGVGGAPAAWFISFLQRLGDLSKVTLEDVTTNPSSKLFWRYHEIDWEAKNVPMKRSDFDWLPKDVRENEEEFPFVQFHISKALGRVIGFWDHEETFNIVLLDPLHNLQPSKYNGYQLRQTDVGFNELAIVMRHVEEKVALCRNQGCQCRAVYSEIQAAVTASLPFKSMLVAMDDTLFARCSGCVEEGLAESVAALIDLGLTAVER